MTNHVEEGRRNSFYLVPVPKPRKGRGGQETFDAELIPQRREENTFINDIRKRVAAWRKGGYQRVTPTTRRLLRYWTNPDRDRKLFFCQLEAAETAIYIAEAAKRTGDSQTEEEIKAANEEANPGLFRIAFKMATGSGKTVVMAMLIAWQALNRLANPRDKRFSDSFLIVTPGITIRDRLRVLLPNDPANYYGQRDILPQDLMEELHKAKIVITNYHAFLPREDTEAATLTKKMLARGRSNAFAETPDKMVQRVVCREFGKTRDLIVINDEAHHCYRHRPNEEEDLLTGEDREEANKRAKAARIWISGLEAVKAKIGIKTIYDLSATPFFLRGSGYPEGTLFKWVVSDFSLVDAIESGIVKVPRVPVADDSMTGDQPTYRELWSRIRENLPRKGRRHQGDLGEPILPGELEGALTSLYDHYKKHYGKWEENAEARANGATPPVFIVVCNNTSVSKLIFDHIAGWEKKLPDGSTVIVPGKLPVFSNEENGDWTARPNTILIDSEQFGFGRSHESRIQEDRSPRNRGIQSRASPAIPRPRRGEDHRRGPSPRSHEHGREAGQTRRAR
jgi:type III restriction enzyme